uniref:Uncharacterized protein n=1 Tax=Rhizophora mucronata TaxID=61149 RepID=A0A2P2PJ11_RHIMU
MYQLQKNKYASNSPLAAMGASFSVKLTELAQTIY